MILKNRKLNRLIVLLVLVINQKTSAQDSLSYASFISNVKEFHPLMKIAKNFGEIASLQIKAAKGGFDPQFTSEYENKFFNSSHYYSVIDAKIKQAVYSSHYLSAGYKYAQGDFVNPENRTPNQGLPFIGIETSLLQGFAFDKRRSDVLKAEGYSNYLAAEQEAVQNEILFSATGYYFEWIYAIQELALLKKYVTVASDRFETVKVLVAVNEVAAIDSVEASILFQTRLIDYQQAQQEYFKKSANLLKSNWTNDTITNYSMDKIITKDSLDYYYLKARMTQTSLLTNNDMNNPSLLKLTAQGDVLRIDQRLKKELIKPKLDLSYNLLSNKSLSTFNTNNYNWGIKFSMPIGMRMSRNEFALSKIRVENNSYEFDTKFNEIQFKVNYLVKNIAFIDEQIGLAEKNKNFSTQLLNAEKIKFEAGESSLFLVNTRESKLLESELKLAAYKTKYILTLFELMYTKGTLQFNL
jgi:outer membrane protein TolC